MLGEPVHALGAFGLSAITITLRDSKDREFVKDAPVRHHREPGHPCPFTVERDVTFLTGEFMHPDLPGANYPACRACAPHLPTLDLQTCEALNATTTHAHA